MLSTSSTLMLPFSIKISVIYEELKIETIDSLAERNV
jgi:hypothetical protein